MKIRMGFTRFLEADHYETLIQGWNIAGAERIRGIHRWHPLEINIGAGELRHDVMGVIIHPPQNGIGYGFSAISSFGGVTMDFLDPFQIDDGRHANQQVDITRHIDFIGDDPAMQSLVEQQVAARR